MKIAFDAQIFVHQRYGGVSRYVCELARRIAASEEVAVLAPMNVNAYIHTLPNGIWRGFESPFPFTFMRSMQRATGLLICDPMLRAESPDVIHESYYFSMPLGSRRARRVLTLYDMIHEKLLANGEPSRAVVRAKAKAVARADHVICISDHTRQDALELLNLDPAKVSVIHLGFALPTEAGAEKYPDNTGAPPYLLYVGLRGGYKNFECLLKAYALSAQLKNSFHLVCFGGGAFTQDELALIDQLHLPRAVVRQEAGDDEALAQAYRGATAFVFPSLYEGFGIPPLEAMSHDCPVVCSSTSSIPEVVGNAGRYFDPTDPSDLASQLVSLLGSPSETSELIYKGRRRLDHFSWDICAQKTLEVYRSLI